MRWLGRMVLATLLCALLATQSAAQQRHGHGGYQHRYAPAPRGYGGHWHNNYGGAIAGGALLGLGLGALLGGVLVAPPPVIYAPPPPYYYYNGPPPYYVMPYAPPPPVYYGY